MARLRADCPWDKKQSNHSLIPYAIEEAYELGEAVQSDDDEDIKGELGDVLLQVVFHCQMYAEQGRFDMCDVITTLQEKLIRRHPHVFEAETLTDEAAVKARWDEIKAE
ncbi:MazG nucleotide pyrophosphohydrolase domain-containing protein, partial [Psychrobacter sp. 1U2]